jgi:CRP-like cAMP-binding protein
LLLADKSDLSSVRLADFGLARACFEGEGVEPATMSTVCGTPTYVAPEIVTGAPGGYTNAVDCWSAGVILFILLSGVVPFEAADEQTLFVKIATGAYSVNGPEWAQVSADAKALVRGLICVAPRKRLSAAAALGHAWMTRREGVLPGTALAGGLKAFAARAKLPARVYPPGAYLLRQGDVAAEVYLIRRGACDVILEAPAPSSSNASGSNASSGNASSSSSSVVARRAAGEFVGEMGVLMDEHGRLTLPGLSEEASRCAAGGGGGIATSATSADASSGDASAPPRGRASGDAAASEAADELRLRDADALAAPPSAALAPPFADDVKGPQGRPDGGGRRTASVRAVGEVEVLVLRGREVRWALEHDTSVRAELVAAIETRQRELRDAHAAHAARAAAAAQAAAAAAAAAEAAGAPVGAAP